MKIRILSFKSISFLFTFAFLISCDNSLNANEDTSVYALKNSTNFKDVKGYMVYAHMDTHLTYMELRLRNLGTGDDEVLLSTKNTIYSTLMPANISSDGQLIFVKAHKPKTDNTFMLIYNLKQRTHKELNVGHSAIAGDISPDKSKIVFYSDFNDRHDYSIYISDLDGTNLLKLDCPDAQCWHPSWNSDGSRITYVANKNKIYVYSIATKKHHKLYTVKNKRKYKLSYPRYYDNNIYFSKTKKKRVSINSFNTEIIKISNNEVTSFFKSVDSFYSISFLTSSIFLHTASKINSKEKYARIQINNMRNGKYFPLTTSDIFKFQNDAPFYIESL